MRLQEDDMVNLASTQNYRTAWYTLALTRILLGFVFLWAFLDKTFGLGFSTAAEKAWVAGGSPTSGFLKMGVNPESPFATFFNGLAGNGLIDALFMTGLLGIGLSLMVGIGLRIAAVSGTILMLLIWATQMPLTTNPLVDDHIVYASLLWVIAAGRREFSAAQWWTSLSFVKEHKWLW